VPSPPFHAIPFALFNRGELVSARFDSFFCSDAAPVCFPPDVLFGPVLRFLQSFGQSCTVVVLDKYTRESTGGLFYNGFSRKARKLAGAGDSKALLLPSKEGWSSESGISVDLWAFQIVFH